MIGLFGGTFDPIHLGHIQLAHEVSEALDLARVDFIPCRLPVHRDSPGSSAEQRLRMVELALAGLARFSANAIEVERETPSYAIDTLQTFKQQHPDRVLCWMMGADAYKGFSQWKDPRGILQIANLVVCARPGVTLQDDEFASFRVETAAQLRRRECGGILLHPMQPNTCSATGIRQNLRAGNAVSDCLYPPVINFIQQHHLYEF